MSGRSIPLCASTAGAPPLSTLPPLMTSGSVILTWPPTVLLLKFPDEYW
jgi:hypothetical protein